MEVSKANWKCPIIFHVSAAKCLFTWVVADGLLGVAGRVVEGEAGAEEPEEDGGAHARDRRHVQLPHEKVPLAILHLMIMDECMRDPGSYYYRRSRLEFALYSRGFPKFSEFF